MAKISIETDWDQPNGYIEEEFEASSLKDAAERVRKSVLYNQRDLKDALNQEFDYNWCIIPDIVEWNEAASLLNEHHNLENYGHKVSNISAVITPVIEGSITVDISKEWKEQNKVLSDNVARYEKKSQLEKLKRELGE